MTRADATVITILAATWVGAAGLVWGTWSVGGADSYGYISQAALWLRGTLVIEQPLASAATWPDADWTLTPLGYRPGVDPGTIVPIYPPGLPLVMAALHAIAGPAGVFLAVPLLGAVAVIGTSMLATRLSGVVAGAFAGLLLGASPTMNFAVMWPMSDVPAAAWWVLTLVGVSGRGMGSSILAGLAAGLAVLTRPNLVGMAIVPACYLGWRVWTAGADRRRALRRGGVYVGLLTAACLGVAAINTHLYGSPLDSGYGDLDPMFAWSRGPVNLVGFVWRPLAVEPMLTALAIAGAIIGGRRSQPTRVRALTWTLIALVGVLAASYVMYYSFPEWWYLRLLLPIYPIAAVLGGLGVAWLGRFAAERWRVPQVALLGGLAGVIVLVGLTTSVNRDVYRQRQYEVRYEAVGRYVARELPDNAVLFAFHHSGSLRHYAGRMTLRFDLLAPDALDEALEVMRARGLRPYFVVEDGEVDLFRARFGDGGPVGQIDWPPAAAIGGSVGVRIFDPADLGPWQEGASIETQAIDS